MAQNKKLLIFKILLFAFAFFIAFMPATSMRNKEVNSRVIVEILGIDGGDELSVTAQYVMPSDGDGASGKDTVTVSASTLTEALEQLNTALGRRAELGHCSMVIVGKDTDTAVLGTLLTATDVTADVQLSAAEDKASELIGEITDFMKKTGATDADFIAYSAKRSHIATNTLLGFLSDLGSVSKSAYMPVVKMLQPEEESSGGSGGSGEGGGEGGAQQSGGSSGGGQSSGGEDGGQKKEQSGMNVQTLALYNADGRAGIFSHSQARGVAWVSAPIEKGIVTADVSYGDKTIKDVSGRLLKKSSSVKVDCANKIAKVKLHAYIEPNGDKFNELEAGNSSEALDALKAGYSKKIKSEIESAFVGGMQFNCDPLFFGRECYRYSPDHFEKGFCLSDLTLEISVEVSIK